MCVRVETPHRCSDGLPLLRTLPCAVTFGVMEEQQVEIFEGEGVAGSLELVLAPGTASGYAGVRPSGRMWLVRHLVGRSWRNIGSFHTAQAAAVQVALAKRGEIAVRSPRPRKPRSSGHHPAPHDYTICWPTMAMVLPGSATATVAGSGHREDQSRSPGLDALAHAADAAPADTAASSSSIAIATC